jgi:drug/metabolite transporter (DMT)-like permease
VLAIALSLVAAGCWGTSDFMAGVASRRLSSTTVVMAIQMLGLVVCLVLLAVFRPPLPSGHEALASLAAGACGVIGLAAFYRALAVGTMSIVAPVGATGVALPVVVGLLGGDHLRGGQSVGLVATVAGVVLASRSAETEALHAESENRAAIPLALVAAVGFGGYFSLSHIGARGGVLWLLAVAHLPTIPIVLVLLATHRVVMPSARGDVARLAGIMSIDLLATGLYGVANRHGALTIVAVAGSLYPVVTLLLARAVLSERLQRLQGVGVVAALSGVALLAAG